MKKKILGELIEIVIYITIMVLCIVALPHVEDFANQFDYDETMWLFVIQCLAIIWTFWCPVMILIAISEIHKK